jgi:GxxExxY protein
MFISVLILTPLKHEELIHKIIEAAMEVHKHPGNDFQEVIYQRTLSIELNLHGIDHEREKEMQIQYKGYEIGTRRVDFFVEDN